MAMNYNYGHEFYLNSQHSSENLNIQNKAEYLNMEK